ncbi:MAG: helicase, partial [Sphingopyxis sp.]|nr:helicase [Sphingopyxis sp.]
MSRFARSPLTAVLGPTNTGKTHLAVERMLGHSSGIMGFPLRLIAREIYDRVVAAKGESAVALVTGEERIWPESARYILGTAEAMPVTRPGTAAAGQQSQGALQGDVAFVAIDEAQIGQDRERGHIFTSRLLHARGRDETMILGSGALGPVVRSLLPEA